MPAYSDRDSGCASASCSQRFRWGIAFPRLSTTPSLCVRGITIPPLALRGKRTGYVLNADLTGVQKCCCTQSSGNLLGFPVLFLEGLIIAHRKGRQCCLQASIPAAKGLAEGCAPGWASPGDLLGSHAGALPVPAAGAEELSSLRALSVLPPRDS